jgi:carbohydrate diacid regulator
MKEGSKMISNQILQSTIEGLKNISKMDFGVYDTAGKLLVSTSSEMDAAKDDLLDFAQSQADSQTIRGVQFFKVYDEHQLEYILLAQGSGDENLLVGKMAVFQLQGLLTAYKERFDKDNFIKNLLLDNLLLVDIYNRAKKLHITPDARRVVYILEAPQEKDHQGNLENIKNTINGKNSDFITAIDEKSIIIVKELEEEDDYAEAEKFANSILDAVGRDPEGDVHIAFGTIVKELKEVSRSYKEAKMAMDVGKIFSDGKDVYAYNQLGIGRLIYQLPIPLCKMFIREIFANKSPDDFDEETLTTINKFFENNLNVSETSRQLYIHRNTLVYRLDKLQKSTGLDLRVFEDAITFKIALMVVKYMKYMETLDY